MQVVRLEARAEAPAGGPKAASVVSVGNFDGVHLGHQVLVRAAVASAHRLGVSACALTFDPHPARILQPERAPRSLMTLEHKAECLGELGMDVLAILPFDSALAAEAPEGFARRVLADGLHARVVVVGESFRFGKTRAGDVALLRRLGRDLGFEVEAIPAVLHEGRPVSSTRIRESLAQGDVETAGRLLGRPYFVEGRVVRGEGRGRELGIPTANLEVENEILPRNGVYAGRARTRADAVHLTVVNVGRRPTFGGAGVTVEAHLIGYEGDLYGQDLRLFFEAWLREEQRFADPQALVRQVRADVTRAELVLRGGADGV